MKYEVILYGVAQEEKSNILSIMAQWNVKEIDFKIVAEESRVRLHTVLPTQTIETTVPLIIIRPVDDYTLALHDISRSIKDTIVVCRMWQEPQTLLALAVNGRAYRNNMVEFLDH